MWGGGRGGAWRHRFNKCVAFCWCEGTWKITAVKGRCQWTQQRTGSNCICLPWWVNYFKKGHGLTFIQKNYINRVWHHENWTWLFGGDLERRRSFEPGVLGSRCFAAWLDTSVEGGRCLCSAADGPPEELSCEHQKIRTVLQFKPSGRIVVLRNYFVILSKACKCFFVCVLVCLCFLQMWFNPTGGCFFLLIQLKCKI